ncbi:MAG TPA: helix-turn-helix transcriptional regulator [Gemmatimonadaceae bacterium]
MSPKASLGEFEHHVLLAALRLGEDAYTTSILTELEERTGREASAAAIYIALRRLEAAGMVKSQMRESSERGERRERRYVRVTPSGIALARDVRQRLLNLWDGLTIVTGGRRA